MIIKFIFKWIDTIVTLFKDKFDPTKRSKNSTNLNKKAPSTNVSFFNEIKITWPINPLLLNILTRIEIQENLISWQIHLQKVKINSIFIFYMKFMKKMKRNQNQPSSKVWYLFIFCSFSSIFAIICWKEWKMEKKSSKIAHFLTQIIHFSVVVSRAKKKCRKEMDLSAQTNKIALQGSKLALLMLFFLSFSFFYCCNVEEKHVFIL